MRPALAPAALIALAAAQASAESFTCTWRTECYGSFGCEDTGYETYLDGTETGGWTWSTEAGGSPAWEMTPPGPDAAPARVFFVPPARSDVSAVTLTLGSDGEAAFTQHGYLEGVTVVTYLGLCEAR